MATYVILIKEYDDTEKVIYKFGPTEERMGRIEFDKVVEEFRELEQVPNTKNDHTFMRAVSAIARCYKEGKGFPDRTFFAS